jgi:hypothetical protein
MVLPEPDENNEDANMVVDGKDGDAKVDKESVEAMDARWNQKMKEKLERMKTKKVRDMSITVTQKGGIVAGALASRQRRTMMSVDDRIRMSGQGRVREELNEQSGEIDFRTGDTDGKVDIWVQRLSATNAKPSRFALNITVHQTEAGELDEEDAKKRRAEESSKAGSSTDGKVLEQNQVKTQISRLERDMQTLNNRIQTILSNADYNKDQEVSFHTQSVNMNRASTYWPIIQLIVIVITGFTQANHIVRFMRTRHIGY